MIKWFETCRRRLVSDHFVWWIFVGAVVATACFGFSRVVWATVFELYAIHPGLQFELPTLEPLGAQAPTAFDVLADGRLIVLATDDADGIPRNASAGTPELYIESAIGSRDFQYVGSLPLPSTAPSIAWPDFGASFLSISPSGQQAVVGNNNGRIGVFSTVNLVPGGSIPAVDWFQIDHFDAEWFDEQIMVISNSSGVVAWDMNTSSSETIVSGILASAGIALDSQGHLYAAEGFGTHIGKIKKFEQRDWQMARTAGALSFTSGVDVVSFSSASSLQFDGEDNLAIGGGIAFGQPFSQSNALGLYSLSQGTLREFDPNTAQQNAGNFYVVRYNHITGELYVNEPFSLDSSLLLDNTAVYVIVPVNLGDFNQDTLVDPADFSLMAGNWLTVGEWKEGDANRDGFVDSADFAILAGNWLHGEGASAGVWSVPEPEMFALWMPLLLAGWCWWVGRIRGSRVASWLPRTGKNI